MKKKTDKHKFLPQIENTSFVTFMNAKHLEEIVLTARADLNN